MSVQALSWVLDHSPTKGTDRLVLIAIANHAGQSPVDEAWEAWPGVKLIQREARLDRGRTVQDALARLVDNGHLERLVNGAPDERIRLDRRSNLYRIRLDHGVSCDVTPCQWCGVTRSDVNGVTSDDERGDARRPDGVTRNVTQTISEPVQQPSVEPLFVADAPKPKRKSQIGDQFLVTPEMRAWASTNAPGINVDHETKQFVDYWKGKGEARLDWIATWRTWIRNAVKFSAERGGRSAGGNPFLNMARKEQHHA